jgi:hypothetical protein
VAALGRSQGVLRTQLPGQDRLPALVLCGFLSVRSLVSLRTRVKPLCTYVPLFLTLCIVSQQMESILCVLPLALPQPCHLHPGLQLLSNNDPYSLFSLVFFVCLTLTQVEGFLGLPQGVDLSRMRRRSCATPSGCFSTNHRGMDLTLVGKTAHTWLTCTC